MSLGSTVFGTQQPSWLAFAADTLVALTPDLFLWKPKAIHSGE